MYENICQKALSIPQYEDHRERLGTYGISDLVGGLGDGGRCAMWVKNRDYRLRRRRRRGRFAPMPEPELQSVDSFTH